MRKVDFRQEPSWHETCMLLNEMKKQNIYSRKEFMKKLGFNDKELKDLEKTMKEVGIELSWRKEVNNKDSTSLY